MNFLNLMFSLGWLNVFQHVPLGSNITQLWLTCSERSVMTCLHDYMPSLSFGLTTVPVVWPQSDKKLSSVVNAECWSRLLTCLFAVLSSSSVPSVGVMAVLLVLLLSVLLLSLHTPGRASPSCPVSCRCYSLTVECGSTSLRDIPKHVPPSTQVGLLYSALTLLQMWHQSWLDTRIKDPMTYNSP